MGHELGHCFGLKHCIHFNCLMQGSNNGQEAEKKLHELCPVCHKKLFFAVEFDPVERFLKLKQWCVELIAEMDSIPPLNRECGGETSGCYELIFRNWIDFYQRRIDAIVEKGEKFK